VRLREERGAATQTPPVVTTDHREGIKRFKTSSSNVRRKALCRVREDRLSRRQSPAKSMGKPNHYSGNSPWGKVLLRRGKIGRGWKAGGVKFYFDLDGTEKKRTKKP